MYEVFCNGTDPVTSTGLEIEAESLEYSACGRVVALRKRGELIFIGPSHNTVIFKKWDRYNTAPSVAVGVRVQNAYEES